MTDYTKQEPIAIVGASCRLAGEASSMGGLWDMISNVKTGHCKIPPSRWDREMLQHPDPDRKGTMAVQHGYFLQQDLSQFDAPFFSTTAKEAAAMDPMKRLLLEVSYESIENAGIPMENLINSQTGCYVGCMTNDYEMSSTHDIQDLGYSAATGTSEAMTANRVSWFFGLRGPSLTLDTACSSSLYALHLACQSLKLKEADQALVAGVNLILYPNCMEQFSGIHMLSPEGISHSFDERANGYGRGEGIGCMVVKRLSDAIRDGDTIRAVVRHTGLNADGKTPSITQPSSEAQAELIRRTYAAADLSLTSTQYFESHGTGTPVGDPIELSAIGSTLGAARLAEGLGPLYVGTVKPNVGHTEGCSGLASVFKAVLCLEKGMLVPTYGIKNINSKLALDEWNLSLPQQTMRWPTAGARRISVNSFGFGGANAHVILDDAYHYLSDHQLTGNHNTIVHDDDEGSESGISLGPSTPPNGEEGLEHGKHLFVFSTRDQAGIQRIAQTYSNALEKPGLTKDDPRFLRNLAHTLAVRRSQHDFRTFTVASSLGELSLQLSKPMPKGKRSSRRDDNLIFVFTGQGAQWPAMGTQLLNHPVFESSIKASQRYLESQGCQWNVFEELGKTEGSNIALPEFSQTLCTVLQLGLVDLLHHWKIRPKATIGHSSGEIAAAYAASYIDHSDAIKIAYVRGISSSSVTQQGGMLASGLTRDEAQEYIDKVAATGTAVVACINSPRSVTLSGDVAAIQALEKLISADGKFARALKVKTAYHSPHMRSVAPDYLARMGNIATKSGDGTMMFSSLTGKLVVSETLNPQYWVSNMCAPVEFSAALTALLSHSSQSTDGRPKKVPIRWGALLEIGPHPALQGPVQQTITAAANQSAKDAPYLSMVLRGKDATETALTAAGQLWASGVEVDLTTVNGSSSGLSLVTQPKVLTSLPSYPWNHSRRFWHEAYATRSIRFPLAPRTDLLGMPEDLQNQIEPRWKNYLRISENPWIEDHKITGTILYPAAGMLIMALEGVSQLVEPSRKVQGYRFCDVNFERGLVVTSGDEAAVETRLSLMPHRHLPDHFQFTVFSNSTGSSWTKHCTGTISIEYDIDESEVEGTSIDMLWARQADEHKNLCFDRSAQPVDIDNFYEHLESKGMEYGPLFRNVISLTSVPAQKAVHGAITIPDTKSVMPANFEYPHLIHPATMDAIFHLLLATVNDGKPTQEAVVPYHLESMFIAAEQLQGPGTCFYGSSRLTSKARAGREIVGSLLISDQYWTSPKIIVSGFALRQVTAAESDGAGSDDRALGRAKKCARIEWSEDLDFICSPEDIDKLLQPSASSDTHLGAWLDRLAHKKPVDEVLIIVDDSSEHSKATLRGVLHHAGHRVGFGKITALATTPSHLDQLHLTFPQAQADMKLWNAAGNDELPAAAPNNSYDLIMVLGSELFKESAGVLADMHKMLANQGSLVVCQREEAIENVKALLRPHGFASIATTPSTPEILIATKNVLIPADLPSEIYFLLPSPSSAGVSTLSSAVAVCFASMGVQVHSASLSLENTQRLVGKHVLSFLEVESPLIYSWSDDQFVAFKSLVSVTSHLFWITRGSLLESWKGGVEFAPAQGLLRVMRNEYPLAALPHLDVSVAFDLKAFSSAELIFKTWKATLTEPAECEFAEKQGMIYIPRAVDDAAFEGDLRLADHTAKPVLRPIRGSGRAMKPMSRIDRGAYLWAEDERLLQPLRADEVEIEVEFACLNPLIGMNNEDDESILQRLSQEAVGLVSRCGSNVKSVVPNQRVVVFGAEACKTHVRQVEALVAAVPDNLLPQEVVVLPSAFLTALYALDEVAGLKCGQTVFIHDAASFLGQAAIQVAQAAQADLFMLVESRAERRILENHGVVSSRIFDSKRRNFVAAIEDATNGRGIDVLLCGRHGPAIQPSLDVLANSAYVFDLGSSDATRPPISLPTSKRNASLVRVNLGSIQSTKDDVIKRLFKRIFRSRTTGLYPTEIFPAGDAADAVDVIKSRRNGSIVLSIDKNTSVLTKPPPAEELRLDVEGTYVLAGGLGALGLNIADMMVDHGAKHLVFLSRSGGSKNEQNLKNIRDRNIVADAYKCDVNDLQSLTEVFNKLRGEGRIVKGVIQCAMVLEDTIFENMSYEQWMRAFRPKTRGSRNLLAQLSSDDAPFFILLSSITGVIGNTAQANYASGNTFEDALAHHARHHLGIPATSIDVGLVSDSSHFTESGGFGDLKNYLHRYQHGWAGLQCTLEELKTAMQAIMRGSTADGSVIPAQTILGLGDKIVRASGTTGFERDRKFELRVVSAKDDAGDGTSKGISVSERLSQVGSAAEAATVVEEAFKTQIAAAFGIEMEEVDGQKPLPELGVDSLKAVEIRNRVLKEMQSEVSVFELLSATPLAEVASKIAASSGLVKVEGGSDEK